MGLWDWIRGLFKHDCGTSTQPPVNAPESSTASASQPSNGLIQLPWSAPLNDLLKEYAADYARAQVRPEWQAEASRSASAIQMGKSEYQKVVDALNCGMPWWVVGLIHLMESDLDWKAYLGNGEHIIGTGNKSTLVPAGRGPFATFHEGAIDALETDRVKSVKTWDVPNTLHFLEGYNGSGYRSASHNIKTPYLWCGTTLYSKGKYVADGVWDANAQDKQGGCVFVMKAMGIV